MRKTPCRPCPKTDKEKSEEEFRKRSIRISDVSSKVSEKISIVSEGVRDSIIEEEVVCIEEEGEVSECHFSTTGNLLDVVIPDPRRKRRLPWGERVRFENLVPCDVTNDHQYRACMQKTTLDERCELRVTSQPNWKRQTNIIATINNSSVEQIEELLESGMNLARIDMASGDRCDHLSAIQNFETAVKNFTTMVGFRIPVATIIDLKGPRITTGRICRTFVKNLVKPEMFLGRGNPVKLIVDKAMEDKCTPAVIYVDFDRFPKVVRPDMKIYFGNGTVKVSVISVEPEGVDCVVEEEGMVGNNEEVHIPMVPVPLPSITDYDLSDIEFAIEQDADFISISKTCDESSIRGLKGLLVEKMLVSQKQKEKPIMILAKISTFEGLTNIDKILAQADGIIIERTDLELELPSEKVCVAQKEIVAKCNVANKPVACSFRMTKSDRFGINNSEIFDVTGCVFDGADCVCLMALGETPSVTVERINHILREADAAAMQRLFFRELTDKLSPPIEPKVAVGMAACLVAEKIRAPAIIILTSSGKSAQIVSWFKPRCIIVGITRFERTARQMSILRGVAPLHFGGPNMADWCVDVEQRFQYGIAYGKEIGFIRCGDPVVLVSGYGRDSGFTNCVRIIYTTTEPSVYLEHPKEYYDKQFLGESMGEFEFFNE